MELFKFRSRKIDLERYVTKTVPMQKNVDIT